VVDTRKGMDTADTLPCAAVESRGLTKPFVEMYGGRVEYDPATGQQAAVWWPKHKKGKIVGWKVASLVDKKFSSVGDGKDSDLFGMHLDGGRRLCIVTEGEADAVATKQLLAENGKDYRVVSLPNGSSASMSKDSHEFLATFESVIIATDMDGEGDKAAEKIAELLGPNVCKRAILPYKDANDCLLEGNPQEFFNAIMSARSITADGVVLGSDTWNKVLEDYTKDNYGGIPFPWDDLNAMSYGSRLGELDTWTSGTGMGKSQLMAELTHHWSITHDQKVGVLALEEDLATTIIKQMSVCADLPLHLPEVRTSVSEEDLRKYWEMATANDNLVCVDHWGSVEESRLIGKLRYLASGMGCKYIVIDHLSILVSETATDGDERKNIDVLMTKLKRLTEELQIHISLVSHLRKASGTPFEEGATPSLDDLRGSGSIKQLSHQVYALSRNQQHHDLLKRNTTKLTVLKNRFCGRTGDAGLLTYESETGRMHPSILTLQEYANDEQPNVMDRRG